MISYIVQWTGTNQNTQVCAHTQAHTLERITTNPLIVLSLKQDMPWRQLSIIYNMLEYHSSLSKLPAIFGCN